MACCLVPCSRALGVRTYNRNRRKVSLWLELMLRLVEMFRVPSSATNAEGWGTLLVGRAEGWAAPTGKNQTQPQQQSRRTGCPPYARR